jgi:hypothetical protein
MKETSTQGDRDQTSGRFVTGNNGGPGRKPGSRNRLGEQFIQDLALVWEEHGVEALRRCALEEPAAFCRVISSLMPKDININSEIVHLVDPAAFSSRFRAARELLELLGNGNRAPQRVKVIDAR